mmetsp:Transcript_85737/g.243157  ORF Transcript_85737/g.243157 Transcript_85737/m.243157 type:complete len:209 (-) Transcript_85737:214-840(-)
MDGPRDPVSNRGRACPRGCDERRPLAVDLELVQAVAVRHAPAHRVLQYLQVSAGLPCVGQHVLLYGAPVLPALRERLQVLALALGARDARGKVEQCRDRGQHAARRRGAQVRGGPRQPLSELRRTPREPALLALVLAPLLGTEAVAEVRQREGQHVKQRHVGAGRSLLVGGRSASRGALGAAAAELFRACGLPAAHHPGTQPPLAGPN